MKHPYFKDLRESETRYAFSTTQPLMYPQQNSDKDDRSSKMASKHPKVKKLSKLPSDLEELPPIKKKDSKKLSSYGKTYMFGKKPKPKNKYVSPYVKKKANKMVKLE